MERGEAIVANPGHDQYCASLGAGAMEEGRMLISGGTAWVVLLTTGEPIFGATGLPAPGRHLEAGKWGLMSAFPTAGVSVDWFRNALCGAGDPGYTRQLELEAKSIPPGSNGVVFLPYFTGSSAPTWSTGMRGSILGLTLKHSRAHVFRALLEGVGYDILWKIESYRDVGARLESIRMIGGATRSLNWPGIVSNMLGVPIQVPRIEESAALGAAILAGKAAGAFGGLEEGAGRLVSVGSTYQPDPETNAMYRGLFPCYQRAFEDVRGALEPIPSRR
jgi:xylulokinase